MNLNKVFLIGNLTRDPETRALPSGQSVASFGIATNRIYKKDGKQEKQTEFHNIVAFGRRAGRCFFYFHPPPTGLWGGGGKIFPLTRPRGGLCLGGGGCEKKKWGTNSPPPPQPRLCYEIQFVFP